MENVSRSVYETLKLLRPYDIDLEKVRYGNDRDGCYILAEPMVKADIVSFGISNDVGFEMEMANQGRKIFMFDHTIEGLPANHPNFNFKKKGICATAAGTDELASLEDHLADLPPHSDRMILKIDVEGWEWGVFATATDEVLGRFDQILVEMHWMENLGSADFRQVVHGALMNLTRQFTLFHVHANNCRELRLVDGFTVADTIEVSFVKTSLVERRRSTTVYPTAINKANYPGRHDLPLLFFPFLPMSADIDRIDEVVKRIDLEQHFID